MDVLHPRCVGIDISKRDAKVCVRIVGEGRARATSTVTTWRAVTNQVLALRDHLIGEQVSLVVMEATSDLSTSRSEEIHTSVVIVPYERPDASPSHAVCLEAHDLVISKLVAGREKDLVGSHRAGLVDPDTLVERAEQLAVPGAVVRRVRDSIQRRVREAGRA